MASLRLEASQLFSSCEPFALVFCLVQRGGRHLVDSNLYWSQSGRWYVQPSEDIGNTVKVLEERL